MSQKDYSSFTVCLLGMLIAEIMGLMAVLPSPKTLAATPIASATQPVVQAPIAQRAPTVEASPEASSLTIVSPAPNAIADIPSTTVIVKYALDHQLELRINGTLVNASLIGRTETDAQTKHITQTWYGVTLKDGENVITAQTLANGKVEKTSSVVVQVRGTAAQLTLRTVETRVPADGRSTITLVGQLLDAIGNRSNRDAIMTLNSTAGEFIEPDANPEQPGYQVKAIRGEFQTTLRSGIQAQTVRIQATTDRLEAFTQVQFETDLRSSIVTGSIDLRFGKRGTDFYRSFQDFLPPDGKNNYRLEGRGAVFATGKVRDWLVTGAYNSDRALNQTCDGTAYLFRDQQFCDQTYPVYGDSSRVDVLTPSIDSVFLKVERTSPTTNGIDYLMWGDYNTEEFAARSQQFTATSRQLHGFKSNYNIANLQLSAFYGNNVQGFQRDTIAPDGTSGVYFLSRRLIIGGSETVFLETEELNRPGTVLGRTSLNRGVDYEIDYDRGTLLFRQPILRTDVSPLGEVLVRRIVTTYQYEDQQGDKSDIFAGRAVYHFSKTPGQERWIGATYLRESQGIREFELYGSDALISFSNGSIIAEYARSSNRSDVLGLVSGSAYRLEANAQIAAGIQARGYYRSTDTGFANDATVSFVPGQTRYGAEVTGAVSATTKLRAQYDHEDNIGIAPRRIDTFQDLFAPRTEAIPGTQVDNSLTTIALGVQQRFGNAALNVDVLHRDRTDRLSPDSSGSSDQLRSRLSLPLTSTLTFLAQNETTLSAKTDAVYSDRTGLGLSWAVMPGMSLDLTQQFYTRGHYAGQSITNLGFNSEYKFGSDTTLHARYGIIGGANSWTTQGAIGVNQGVTITPGLRMDLAYERIFGDFLGSTGAGTRFAQPFAVGQSASALGLQSGDNYSAGIEYTGSKEFQASARYEHRNSSGGDNTVISAAATGKISPALTALIRYQQANAANQTLIGLDDTKNLKLGLAYRDPNDDKFNALLRFEYRKNPSTIPDTVLFGTGTGTEDRTIALEGIYAPTWRWEFYGKYALRHSTSYLANDLVGTGNVSLAQLRATYRFGYSWDLVGEVRRISQSSAGYSETGLLLEAGYYLTPNLRLAAGYSFGRVSDRDFDGSRSAGGFYAGLTIKLNELFNGFGLQKAAPPQQQASTVKPTTASMPEKQ
ncbi:TonB-dependent receptor [Myxacorys almedinensis]|uniref:TonB-dependent receptor n=1 Tax=Myxacorys almedinensis A TaxID=2690445 RepID=A0A8J7YZG8_9CYAN|nr:TonB-dependent receptor [Myxacorys almedinensis]NDJ16914.1 TonB-dependent receptor [Myxacorys almedinensis A]